MLRATNVLEKLKAHPVLQYLNLDGVGAFTRLASHLKRDILQPQYGAGISNVRMPSPIDARPDQLHYR